MRNGSLWSNFSLKITKGFSWCLLLCIWKHTRNETSVFYFRHCMFSCNFDDKLGPSFHRFVMLCMMGYTKWEHWSLALIEYNTATEFKMWYSKMLSAIELFTSASGEKKHVRFWISIERNEIVIETSHNNFRLYQFLKDVLIRFGAFKFG